MATKSYEYKSSFEIVIEGYLEPANDLYAIFLPGVENPIPGQPTMDRGSIILQKENDTRHAVIVSLGKYDKISQEPFRQAGGELARWLRKSGASAIDIDLNQFKEMDNAYNVLALIEGLWLGEYEFSHYKTHKKKVKPVTVHLRTDSDDNFIKQNLDGIRVVTHAVNTCRDWSFEPANVINPDTLSIRAQSIAKKYGIDCTILDARSLEQMKAGAILAVGKGSSTPPKMIVMEYHGQGTEMERQPIVLVGKALTFDSGGYSIKDSTNIRGMKYDKIGGILVIAILQAAAELKVNVPVVGIIAAAENMISENAYRPDDIITTLSGKTVEIVTTDAEGRLVLADALTYAQKNYKPAAIIDLATLTGGVITALGRVRAGMMTNDDALGTDLFDIGEKVYERLWRLPLDEEYLEATRGDDADLKNSGGREAHPIMGGIFLKQFVDDSIPWAHIDIAGVSDLPKQTSYCPKGATGFGVRLLINYLLSK